MEARLGASAFGLFLTACDVFLTRKQELEYVWKKPFQLTLVRSLFILARYLAILIHTADIVLAKVMITKSGDPQQLSEHLCMSLLVFRIVSCQSMLFLLHLVLMLRVFALYNQSVPIGVFLLLLIVVGFVGSTVSVVQGFTRGKIEFAGPCFHKMFLTDRRQNPILILICGESVIQLILHGLVWKRTIWDFRCIALSRLPIFPVLNRDGLKVFAGISAAMSAIGVGVFKRGIPVVFIFPLLITFVSASCTRTILNLQNLSVNQATPSSLKSNNQMELTTVEDLTTWEAPWDTSSLLEL